MYVRVPGMPCMWCLRGVWLSLPSLPSDLNNSNNNYNRNNNNTLLILFFFLLLLLYQKFVFPLILFFFYISILLIIMAAAGWLSFYLYLLVSPSLICFLILSLLRFSSPTSELCDGVCASLGGSACRGWAWENPECEDIPIHLTLVYWHVPSWVGHSYQVTHSLMGGTNTHFLYEQEPIDFVLASPRQQDSSNLRWFSSSNSFSAFSLLLSFILLYFLLCPWAPCPLLVWSLPLMSPSLSACVCLVCVRAFFLFYGQSQF